MTNLSVIIVTWNSRDYIRPCLDSLFSQGQDLEIIAVDNGSQDSTLDVLREYGTRIKVVGNQENLGFARAANQGLKRAAGDFILLLNPDTVLTPGALESMAGFLAEHPKIWALGPQLLNLDGSVQRSCRQFPDGRIMFYEFTGLSRLFPKSKTFGRWRMGYFDHLTPARVDQPMGACLMVKRVVLDKVGLLDEENFSMFFNEVDWCLRISRAGGRLYFLPQAKVYHHHGVSTRRVKKAMIISSHQSLARYFSKHYPNRFSTLLIRIMNRLTVPLRLWLQGNGDPKGKN
ncbi:glycosyltransferase family 2 protein [candidate division TA06 bacterium]|uniref:Glycosyltransferase family 2 protein n=1 Tax=candidate division TA06 bacterium TaxID=2250710 RepID=A0A933I8A1_UNCT6|nr:glycosyltransferase family 2 protein [candidate division TA06 bacterium]